MMRKIFQSKIGLISLAVLFSIIFIPSVFAGCEDFMIERDIEDFLFNNVEVTESPGPLKKVCKVYYDSYDYSQEPSVFIYEYETEFEAKNHIIKISEDIGRIRGPNGGQFLNRLYNPNSPSKDEASWWQSENYVIVFAATLYLKSEECNEYDPAWCIINEYVKEIGNTMHEIFPEESCFKWGTKLVKGEEEKVCIEYSEGKPYELGAAPAMSCKSVRDCPGEGFLIYSNDSQGSWEHEGTIIRDPGTYYRFQCELGMCDFIYQGGNSCSSNKHCETKSKPNSRVEKICDLDSAPTRCVWCLSNSDCESDEVCGDNKCQKLECGLNKEVINHECVSKTFASSNDDNTKTNTTFPKTSIGNDKDNNLIIIISIATISLILILLLILVIFKKK